MSSQEYFYHSFPRLMRDEPINNNNERGFQIFKNIIKNGLLITPEVIDLPFELEDWQNPVVQLRCCFTLIERSLLESHMEKFGSFSIEWNPQSLKDIGVFPVIYLPLYSFNTDADLEMLGAKFLYKMLRYHEFARRCFNNSKKSHSEATQNKNLAQMFEFNEEMRHFQGMMGWFEGLTNMIYPIEHKRYTDENGYYRQREWKLPGNVIYNGEWVADYLTVEQKTELLNLNHGFFNKEINYLGKSVRQVDICMFFKKFDNRHVLEHANKIIVPQQYLDRVKEILRENNINIEVQEL